MNDNERYPIDDKPIVFIDANADASEDHGDGEVPTITLESENTAPVKPRRRHRWAKRVLLFLLALVSLAVVYAGWRWFDYYYNIGLPIAVSPEENIAKLKQPVKKGAKVDISVVTDSVLGVALRLYGLEGLRGEVALQEPDTTDIGVEMYTRCADHTSDRCYLGSMVVEGKELASDASRLGYCAMADGNIVIGISRSDRVKDYCMERGGSFFRQFVLLSGGVMPSHFQLHGKVERCAIGRMPDNRLFFIATLHKETLWDFADALREYGFVDAIYITGGTCHSFYRDAQGHPHDMGNPEQHPHKEYEGLVPWLVLRANK